MLIHHKLGFQDVAKKESILQYYLRLGILPCISSKVYRIKNLAQKILQYGTWLGILPYIIGFSFSGLNGILDHLINLWFLIFYPITSYHSFLIQRWMDTPHRIFLHYRVIKN